MNFANMGSIAKMGTKVGLGVLLSATLPIRPLAQGVPNPLDGETSWSPQPTKQIQVERSPTPGIHMEIDSQKSLSNGFFVVKFDCSAAATMTSHSLSVATSYAGPFTELVELRQNPDGSFVRPSIVVSHSADHLIFKVVPTGSRPQLEVPAEGKVQFIPAGLGTPDFVTFRGPVGTELMWSSSLEGSNWQGTGAVTGENGVGVIIEGASEGPESRFFRL